MACRTAIGRIREGWRPCISVGSRMGCCSSVTWLLKIWAVLITWITCISAMLFIYLRYETAPAFGQVVWTVGWAMLQALWAPLLWRSGRFLVSIILSVVSPFRGGGCNLPPSSSNTASKNTKFCRFVSGCDQCPC